MIPVEDGEAGSRSGKCALTATLRRNSRTQGRFVLRTTTSYFSLLQEAVFYCLDVLAGSTLPASFCFFSICSLTLAHRNETPDA